jgi:tetratricopeptide (TPR) repeat protein
MKPVNKQLNGDGSKGQCRTQKAFEALLEKGEVHLRGERYEEALHCLLEAAELRPDHREIHYRLGKIYEGMGRLGSAKQSYRRVMEMEPDNVEALTRTARILEREGDYHQAVKFYKKAIAMNPRAEAPRFGLAFLYQHYDMFDEARAAYEALLEKEPAHPLALFCLDRLRFQLGDYPATATASWAGR